MTLTQAHILVVDDTPEHLRSLMSAFRAQNWRANVATSGRQGFHRAQALVPDLIVLDVCMPDMDGLATCRLLKESPRTRDIPIISSPRRGMRTNACSACSKVASITWSSRLCRPKWWHGFASICNWRPGRPSTPSGSMPLLSQGEIILRAAMRLISTNLTQLPPLADIAHKVGTHDKKLSAIFREHLGMTVFAWVREERLRVSRQWLADSHMSIGDIAAQLGFHSAANFATSFRSRMGMTPSQYRKNLQQSDRDGSDDAG